MVGALTNLTRILSGLNGWVLHIGRNIAWVALALMVLAILIQVFFRYVLNNALPWPDEAARFLMLWMTGLIAPTAFRRGGFVAIDMLVLALPERVGAILSLILLFVSAIVLYWAVIIGYGEVTGFGGKFNTAALYVPFNFGDGVCEAIGTKSAEGIWCRMPRSWMFLSLWIGVILMLVVNIELILRSILTMLGKGEDLPPIPPGEEEVMAE
ncbi:MAG: TRAP transporter small permease [Rhizobiaceae bacterium]